MTSSPLRVLSLGAGVQSTTLLRMTIHGDLPPIDHAIFSDTGWEPRAVYEHLEMLKGECSAAGIPLHIVSNGNIRDDALHPESTRSTMPLWLVKPNGTGAMARRKCTQEYKLKPLVAKQRELAGLRPGQRCSEHRITTVIGISWDETQRMKDPLFPWIRNEYPLVDLRIRRAECLTWNRQHGYAAPPRSSCIGCPFHDNAEWRRIRDDPEAWQDAVDFDEAIRAPQHGRHSQAFLHRSRQPLATVDIRSAEEAGQGTLFDMECEGMCGL